MSLIKANSIIAVLPWSAISKATATEPTNRGGEGIGLKCLMMGRSSKRGVDGGGVGSHRGRRNAGGQDR